MRFQLNEDGQLVEVSGDMKRAMSAVNTGVSKKKPGRKKIGPTGKGFYQVAHNLATDKELEPYGNSDREITGARAIIAAKIRGKYGDAGLNARIKKGKKGKSSKKESFEDLSYDLIERVAMGEDPDDVLNETIYGSVEEE